MATVQIKHSNTGEYYEMYVDGNLVGTYDTPSEAAREYDTDMAEEGDC